MAAPFKMYFDAWAVDDPKGTSLGEITEARDKSIQDQLNGTGEGHFVINKHSSEIALAATGNLIRVRLVTGGPFDWDDTRYKFAFYIEEAEGELVSTDEEGGEDWTRQGRGIITVFSRLIWWNESFISDDGSSPLLRKDHWHFGADRTYGHILNRMKNEWNGRPSPGPIPGTLAIDFTTSDDSNGDPWQDIEDTEEGEYDIPIGENYLETVSNLIEADIDIYMSPAFVLSAWNEDGRGQVLGGSVVYRKGWNIRESASQKVSASRRGTRALVQGKDNVYAVATDSHTAGAESGTLGRREIFATYERTRTKQFLKWAGKRALKRLRQWSEGPPTVGVTSSDDPRFVDQGDGEANEAFKNLVPYTDYDVGDQVRVHIPGDFEEDLRRITEITIADSEVGYAEVTLAFETVPFNAGRGSGMGMDGADGPGSGNCKCPPQRPHPPVCTPDPGDTLEKFYNANDAGGDDIAWPGLLGNQGGSADGAAGSDYYYYKSNSPTQYNTPMSASPGDVKRLEGYIGCRSDSGASLIFVWTNAAPGTYPGLISGNILETHVLATNPTEHSHADEWSFFQVGPFEAPAGTTSWAIGRSGGTVDFDEISVFIVTDVDNDEFCVPDGTYTPGDPYDAPSTHGHDDRYSPLGHSHGPEDLNISWKEPVRVATTANGTLATAFDAGSTVDGVVLAEGDRILIKDQTTGADNGIYTVAGSGAPARAPDFDADDDVPGAMVRVLEGTTNADTVWGVTDDSAVIGTDDPVFDQLSGGAGGAGHAIKENGTPLTARAGLNFATGLVATDDAGNNETDVNLDDSYVNGLIAAAIDFGEDADITDQDFGDVADAGATGEVADAGHLHGMPANPVTADQKKRQLHVSIGNGVAVVPTGTKGYIRIPYDCTIIGWQLIADASGSIVIDVWSDAGVPDNSDSITASAPPTLSSAQIDDDTTLSGWTTALVEGENLGFTVDSATTVKKVDLDIWVTVP